MTTDAKGSLGRAPAAWGVLVALAIWDVNDASGPKAVPNAPLLLVVVAAVLICALVRRNFWGSTVPRGITAFVLVVAAVGIMMIPFRDDFYLPYILNDLGTLVFFLLCLVVASTFYEELTTSRTVLWFVILYLAIAVFAYFAATFNLRPNYWWNGRWDPPYFMLFGGLALLLRNATALASRAIFGLALVAAFALAIPSGNRTQLLLGVVFVALAWASSRVAVYAMATFAIAFALLRSLGVVESDPISPMLADSRFALLDGGLDDSLLGRMSEVNDIWYHLTVINTPEQTILGRGAGAVWQPLTRYIEGQRSDIYYLHTGFSHMAYRYGVLGFALFCYWLWLGMRGLATLFDERAALGERFWALGALGFGLNFFLQNSLLDPPAVMAMAVVVITLFRRKTRSSVTPGSSPRLALGPDHKFMSTE